MVTRVSSVTSSTLDKLIHIRLSERNDVMLFVLEKSYAYFMQRFCECLINNNCFLLNDGLNHRYPRFCQVIFYQIIMGKKQKERIDRKFRAEKVEQQEGNRILEQSIAAINHNTIYIRIVLFCAICFIFPSPGQASLWGIRFWHSQGSSP